MGRSTFGGTTSFGGLPVAGTTNITSKDVRWLPLATHAQNDEFNDNSLSGSWTRVDTAGHSGYIEVSEAADSLSLRVSISTDGSGPELHSFMKSYSLAVGESIQMHISHAGHPADYHAIGLIVADGITAGAGNQHVALFLPDPTFIGVTNAAFTGYNARTAGFADTTTANFTSFHFKMKRDTSDVWRVYLSSDGILWDELNPHTHTLTPTYIGICATGWGSTVPHVFSVDYFRVT